MVPILYKNRLSINLFLLQQQTLEEKSKRCAEIDQQLTTKEKQYATLTNDYESKKKHIAWKEITKLLLFDYYSRTHFS